MNSDIHFRLYLVIPIMPVSVGKTWGPLPRLKNYSTSS